MKHVRKVIFLGWIKAGSVASDGESVKNRIAIDRLRELGVKCYLVDTFYWKEHKLRSLALPFLMLLHPKATLIFSSSAKNIYPLMSILRFCPWPQRLIHWVIGGVFPVHVRNGRFKVRILNRADWTLVESGKMVDELTELGVKNVLRVPNFKPVPIVEKGKGKVSDVFRFVFLSRIMAEKGCGYILDSASSLNSLGLEKRFTITFYGSVDEKYKSDFFSRINSLPNVSYGGFMDLTGSAGYEELSGFDVMLFPTYWIGEGFAGVFIDAFIAGLPIIATDWSRNKEILTEGETALFVPAHDVKTLTEVMMHCIEGKYDLERMSKCCRMEAGKYDPHNVITEELLKKLGVA
ncbi:MAG: glycosyltransferase [Bacteroidales bacterium]|nr:glycosyltransferase [Bacteroidales bacterium]